MSSAETPPPDPAEKLTPRNLAASLKSEICPACGRRKAARRSLCWRCWQRLPRWLQRALFQSIDQGYDRAMLQALRELGAEFFILPGESRAQRIQRLPLDPRVLRPSLLERSLQSKVCPRCADAKLAGAVLCNRCLECARGALARLHGGRRGLDLQALQAIESGIFDRLDAATLQNDPGAYARALCDAIRVTRSRLFYLPEE